MTSWYLTYETLPGIQKEYGFSKRAPPHSRLMSICHKLLKFPPAYHSPGPMTSTQPWFKPYGHFFFSNLKCTSISRYLWCSWEKIFVTKRQPLWKTLHFLISPLLPGWVLLLLSQLVLSDYMTAVPVLLYISVLNLNWIHC